MQVKLTRISYNWNSVYVYTILFYAGFSLKRVHCMSKQCHFDKRFTRWHFVPVDSFTYIHVIHDKTFLFFTFVPLYIFHSVPDEGYSRNVMQLTLATFQVCLRNISYCFCVFCVFLLLFFCCCFFFICFFFLFAYNIYIIDQLILFDLI